MADNSSFYPGYSPYSGALTGYPSTRGGNTAFDRFTPGVHTIEHVGKPIEEYRNLLSSLSDRNKSLTQGMDLLDIAMSNKNVIAQDAPILDEAKGQLRTTVDNLMNSGDYSKAEALLRKANRDFQGNLGLQYAEQEYAALDEYKNQIMNKVGTEGFTEEMAKNAIRISQDRYRGVQHDPELDVWTTDKEYKYIPADYVNIGELLNNFGDKYKEDFINKSNITFTEDGRWLVKNTDGSYKKIGQKELAIHMRKYIKEEPGVMAYLNDRFELSHTNTQFESEDDRALANQMYIDGVLNNYIDAYSNKYAYEGITDETSININPYALADYKNQLDNQYLQSPGGGGYRDVPTRAVTEIKIDRILNTINTPDKSIGSIIARNLGTTVGALGAQVGTSDVGKDTDITRFGNLEDSDKKTLTNIGKMLGIDKELDNYTDSDLDNVTKHMDDLKQIDGTKYLASNKLATMEGNYQEFKRFADDIFTSFKQGDKKEDFLRLSKADKTIPLKTDGVFYLDLETGTVYDGSSEEFKEDVIDDVKEGDPISIAGLYNYNNSLPQETGNLKFTESAQIDIAGKKFAVTGATYPGSDVKQVLNTLIWATNLAEFGARPINTNIINNKGNTIQLKGTIHVDYSDENNPKITYDDGSTPIDATSVHELYKKLTEIQ